MFNRTTPSEFTVGNKDELIDQIKKSIPCDIINVKGTTFSLFLSPEINDTYLLDSGRESKRYKTIRHYIISRIKKTSVKIWR